jgi:tetratricopeptide (TPR) repeat protein
MAEITSDALIAQALETEKKEGIGPALARLKEAAKQHPNDQKIIFHTAALLEKSKQFLAALGQYQRIAEKQEKLPPDVALAMARCLLPLKRIDRAQKLFDLLNERAPKNKEVLVGLAGCKRLRKDTDTAESLVRQALAIDPAFMPARHELAAVLFDQDRFDEALAAVEENVFREDLYGDSLDLWMMKLKEHKRERYMQEQLETLMKKFPKKVEFVFAYGVAANRAGEITVALPALEKANSLLPNNSKILYELGVVERISGNTEKAQALIQQSLTLRPDFPAGLRTFGVDHKYAYGDDQFKRLNKAAANLTDMSTEDQVQMQYALAKAFEDVGEFDAAFANYGIAGAKKRKIEEFNERSNAQLFQIMAKVLDKGFFATPRQPGCDTDVPVFILGMPRSGTSLIEQILSSHPDIFGAGELKIMTSVLENISVGPTRLRMNDVQAAFVYEDNASYETRGRRYLELLSRLAPQPYKRIVDKMPGNFNFVGLIHLILPKAKIIHSQRDPVETCLSCYRIHFAEGQQWSYNLRELGRYYRRYWHLMLHWREVLPGVMYEIKYEDNVEDVEGSARALIAHLGLPWTDNCLRFYETERPVKTASASQVRKPIYNTSINRWRKYERYLEPLLEELGDIPAQYNAMLEAGRSKG